MDKWTKGQRGPEPVFRGRITAIRIQNQTMKMILEKLRSLLRSGPGTSRVFWQQTEFTFRTARHSRKAGRPLA